MSNEKDYSQYIAKKPAPEDKRPFMVRLLSSIRPKASIVRDKKTGKIGAKFEISGGAEF